MELEVPIDLCRELLLSKTLLPEALHEVVELCVPTLERLLLLRFLPSFVLFLASLLSLQALSFLGVKQAKQLVDLLFVLRGLDEELGLLVERLILRGCCCKLSLYLSANDASASQLVL